MKRHLLHIAVIGAALSALSTNADAQVSPLLTPRLKLKDPGSVNAINIAPPTLTVPYTLTLPPNDGDAQQVLTTDGNGVLTWTTQSSGSGTTNTIAKFTSATTIGNSNLTDDGTRVVIGGSLIDVGVWGASPSTVTIGNSNVSSSVNIVGGVGGINIGAAAAAGANITVAGGGNLYTLNLGAGSTLGGITQTINIGNGSTTGVKNISIGSNATTSNTTLISGSGGLNLNASINQPTNINTGTSTGTVSIGNSLSTTAIAGATGITGATTINTTGNANTTIGSATTTGTTTIATNGTSGRFVVSGLPVLTSSTDDVLIVNASNQISRIAQTNLIGSSWQLTGNATADAWNGTTGTRLGTTSAQPLVLATTNATAQDIRFFTGANGASERMRILGTGNVGIGSTNPTSPLTVESASTGNILAVAHTGTGASFNFNVDSQGRASMTANGGTGTIAGAYFSAMGREEAWFNVRADLNTAGLRYMRFGNSSNGVTNAFAIQLLNDAGTAVVSTPFRLQNAAPTNSLVIHTDGNVGVGVATPTRRLDVAGTVGATGLITGTAGATISGAATSINASSNFTTNINTGTSTGAVTIGNTSNTTTLGSIATTLKTTLGTNDRVVVANSSGVVDQISPAALVSSATIGARVATATNAVSTTVTDANVTTNDIITVTLETTASTAVIPVFTIVRATGSFTVHFSAPFSGFVNYTIINK